MQYLARIRISLDGQGVVSLDTWGLKTVISLGGKGIQTALSGWKRGFVLLGGKWHSDSKTALSGTDKLVNESSFIGDVRGSKQRYLARLSWESGFIGRHWHHLAPIGLERVGKGSRSIGRQGA